MDGIRKLVNSSWIETASFCPCFLPVVILRALNDTVGLAGGASLAYFFERLQRKEHFRLRIRNVLSSVMYVTYQALDHVDYDTLQCSNDSNRLLKQATAVQGETAQNKVEPTTLQELCARSIVGTDDLILLSNTIVSTPPHLVNLLLRAAIKYDKTFASIVLISEWPAEELRLVDIYPEGKEYLFSPSHKFDNTIFLGLGRRMSVRDKCRMTNLDLRQFNLNNEFKHLMIGGLPFMSLPENERHPQQLTQHLLRHLSQQGCSSSLLTSGSSLVNEILMMLTDKLEKLPHKLYVPEGKKLTILVDQFEFSREERNEMFDFLTVGSLQSVLPYYVEANNLHIKTHVMDNERTIDSCGPFLALLGQKPQALRGLSLNNMEDMLFQYILKGVERFTSLRALDIGDCSVSVSGNTRTRELLRERIVGLFAKFTNLIRLDLSYSDLQGHLITLLDALSTPLQYLNISGCAVEEFDLIYLGNCKHSRSLKEIHLSALVQRGRIDTPLPILNCLKQLVSTTTVVAIQSNEIEGDFAEQLCQMVSKSESLKILDTLYNLMSEEMLMQLADKACECTSLRVLTVNLQPVLTDDETAVVSRREMLQSKIQEIMHKNNRTDITVVVVAMGVEPVQHEHAIDV